MLKNLTTTIVALSLAGCGSIYRTSSVDRVNLGADQELDIRVIPLTEQSARAANITPYTPQRLPAAFNSVAGAGSVAASTRLPEATQPVAVPFPNQEVFLPQNRNATPYVIGISDVILVSSPQGGTTVEQLSGLLASQNRRQGYTVQDDGAIAIPDVGRIELAGLTLKQAEELVFEALVSRNIDPSFSLEIAEFNSKRVSVGGAVGRPTVAPISLKPLKLDEAIQLAGGIAASDLDFVTIRLYRDGTLYQVPAKNLYEGRNDVILEDGDSIFVDTEFELEKAELYFQQQIAREQLRGQAEARALAQVESAFNIRSRQIATRQENFEKRLALGAVKRDYVYTFGEVNNQTRFPLPFEQPATLADALFDGGGLSQREADISQIYVLRRSSDPREFGARTAYHLDARRADNVLLATFFELRPNDIIFVAEQPVTSWNRVISQITPSLLTSSIAAAGR